MKITEEEQQLRKSRIIHKSFQLFRLRGVDQVSMREIADASGVSEKSLYRYFSTKADLIIEVSCVLWKEITTELCRFIDDHFETKTGFEQVSSLLDGFRWLFQEHLDYILFSYDYKLYLIRHNRKLPEDVYSNELAPLYVRYNKALTKGVADGTIRLRGSAEDAYWAVWGLMRGYVAKIAIYDSMFAGENMWRKQFEVARQLVLDGLRGVDRAV